MLLFFDQTAGKIVISGHGFVIWHRQNHGRGVTDALQAGTMQCPLPRPDTMVPIAPLPTDAVLNVASIIQLAVAPVFLLTGVGTMINVLTSRLARIIDRARVLQQRCEGLAVGTPQRRHLHAELRLLSQRARLVSWAISLSTSCSLLVSLSIVVLFTEALLHTYFRGVVPVLFILAMLAFILGLLSFLREILLATAGLRIGPPQEEAH